jgi:glycosyltransferase involved in cell wall biosynthesis
MLRSYASWAKAGRGIVSALISGGDIVHIYERRGFLYDADFVLDEGISGALVRSFPATATLTFEHPVNYRYITSPLKYGMLVCEATSIPDEWPGIVNSKLDLVLVPSEFNRNVFISAGVAAEKIRVLAHGVDEKIYNKDSRPEKRDKFIFLCAAMAQKRKGLSLLIDAFNAAFGGRQDVELVIKSPYAPGKSPYDDLSLRPHFNDKNIRFIFAGYTEQEMAGLYKNADCFVLASRGEGFGMVYLEALACATPVIATGWGGQMDFLNDSNALLVKYSMRDAGEMQYGNGKGKGLMAEPDRDDLVDKLIYAFKNSGLMKEKAMRFERDKFTWGMAALKFKSFLPL